jgi:hypothetical protein
MRLYAIKQYLILFSSKVRTPCHAVPTVEIKHYGACRKIILFIYSCTYVFMYVCMYVFMYVCMYVKTGSASLLPGIALAKSRI